MFHHQHIHRHQHKHQHQQLTCLHLRRLLSYIRTQELSPDVVPDNNEITLLPHNSTPTAASVSKTPTTTKRRKKDMSDDVNSLLMASIQRDLNKPQQPLPQEQEPEEKDPDNLFCLSLVQEFKELPSNKKRIARVS